MKYFSKTHRLAIVVLSVGMILAMATPAYAWTMKQPPITTPWTSQIDPANVLPEYPRPSMVRSAWLNLNGVWQWQPGNAGDALPTGNLSGDILVPFPVESAISGVMAHHPRMWYKRTFTVPSGWNGKKVLLHLDAVDWEAEVYVNNQSLGIHRGGYDRISYDITSKLVGTGPQTLTVRVLDQTTDNAAQRVGKQVLPGNQNHWTMTPTSGIWQPVWLEGVNSSGYISELKVTPDLDNNRVRIRANCTGCGSGLTVSATAKDGTTAVGSVSGAFNTDLFVPISNPKKWSPESPFLYNLDVQLKNGTTVIDNVTSYFGMRSIKIVTVGNQKKTFLNGQEYFQMGVLDQGYWPDGNMTAPTDAALQWDVQAAKDLGFNMIRKHIKVERERWYYWADKLGMLVWQDMPSGRVGLNTDISDPAHKAQFELELGEMIKQLYNYPSIIMWVVFNESWGQYDSGSDVPVTQAMNADPSRLVNGASGWDDTGNGHIIDWHPKPPIDDYSWPITPDPNATRATGNGEFGAIEYFFPNNSWTSNVNDYSISVPVSSEAELRKEYTKRVAHGRLLNAIKGQSFMVYCELVDIEREAGGLISYDRRVVKVDKALFAPINRDTYSGKVTQINNTTTGTANNQFTFSGSWGSGFEFNNLNNDLAWSNTANSFYQVKFSGTKIKVYGKKDTNTGIMAVSIDDGAETLVDTYRSSRDAYVLLWESPTLPNGQHTLKVRVTGTKNPASSNTYINADWVDVYVP